MDSFTHFFQELFYGGGIAHVVFIYALVIAIGVLLGKLKFFGISLGVTFVLFTGLVVSHYHMTVNPELTHFIKEFGLILFVFSIGLQVGPSFFSSFKKGGLKFNGLAVSLITLDIVVALAIFFLLGGVKGNPESGTIPLPMIVGILSGAVTNTPGLGAAQEALKQLSYSGDPIALGYAAAYPLGVLGSIMAFILVRVLLRINLDEETEKVESQNNSKSKVPEIVSVRISNPNVFGVEIREIKHNLNKFFVVSRLKSGANAVCVPDGKTVLNEGDLVGVVLEQQDREEIVKALGVESHYDWDTEADKMVSHQAFVTNPKINGRRISELHLRSGFGVNITRVNRAGIDLIGHPNLQVMVGDRLTIVGEEKSVLGVERLLGNSIKKLNEPNIATIFIGILLGMILGSIPVVFPGIPMPVKLGLAGGPLVVAILIGRFGYKIKLNSYTTQSANLMLREIGICLFLASVGLDAGEKFVDTVFSANGLLWVGCGFLITFIPIFTIAMVALKLCKIDYFSTMGLIAGSTTDPPVLAFSNAVAKNDLPSVGYSTVYPLTMFLRILTAQFIVLLLY